MTVKVDIKDFPKVFKKYGKDLQERFKQFTAESIYKQLPDIVKASPVDTGEYAASWDFNFEEEKAVLGNYAPHAPNIEYGARPFKPPIGPLLEWAKRVLKDPSQPPKFSSKVWALAVGVQKKIQKEGQKPKHILTKQIPKIIKNLRQKIKEMDVKPRRNYL